MDACGTVSVRIADMNEDGVGIARIGSLVVFVPGLLPGEEATIRVTERRKNYALGECVDLLEASDERIEPVCPHAKECGGCTLSHVSYACENRTKENAVRAALRRQGLSDVPVLPIIAGPDRTGYRNKMVLHADRMRGGFGYCRAGSYEVFPFTACALCPPLMSEIARFASRHYGLLVPLGPGSLEIRTSDAGMLVTVGTERYDPDPAERFASLLRDAFPQVSVLFPAGNPDKRQVRDRIAGLEMRVSSDAFRQVNTNVFESLLGIVREAAAKAPFRVGADLYCGSGIIGLTLAKAFPHARFYGMEINPDAVEDARQNAVRNGISNIAFFCGDAAAFRRHLGDGERIDLAVVDPPRAGLGDKMRRELLTLGPERLIYVSCNPQTLARDLRFFADYGYHIESAAPVNQFPMTRHVETVVLMSGTSK